MKRPIPAEVDIYYCLSFLLCCSMVIWALWDTVTNHGADITNGDAVLWILSMCVMRYASYVRRQFEGKK